MIKTFANSAGWILKNGKGIQRLAPSTGGKKSTTISKAKVTKVPS